jgi:hypothetical protein
MTEEVWTARETTPADADDWARLFNSCFGKQKDAATFRWKYLDNPHGPAVARVATDAGGRVVGAYAYLPRRFRLSGQPVTLMQAVDAMTEPDWRGRGIFTGLDDIVCEASGVAGVPWAFAYSGRRSLKGFLSNGWQQIGTAALWRCTFAHRSGARRMGRLAPLGTLLAPVMDVLVGWRHRARLSDGADQLLVRLDRFDASVDELFEAAAPRTGLVGERSAAWLNWRYVDNPTGRQECFAIQDDGHLAGYLVAEWHDGRGYLVDHMARDAVTRRLLVTAFTALSWRRGMEEATTLLFDHHPSVAHLPALGYRVGRRRQPFADVFPFIVRRCRDDAPYAAESMTRWRLADGDRDAEHMSP